MSERNTAFDLSSLDISKVADDGAWFTPRHPISGEALPIKIKLAGRDSKIYKDAERAFTDKRLRSLSQRGNVQAMRAHELEEQALDLLVSVTLDWENVALDGNVLSCTKSNAKALYQRLDWLREQADEFVGTRENFTVEGYAAATAGKS